jgi:hypothetical protein
MKNVTSLLRTAIVRKSAKPYHLSRICSETQQMHSKQVNKRQKIALITNFLLIQWITFGAEILRNARF